jgi:hypothetical protein
MSKRSIPEIRARLRQQELFLRSLAKPHPKPRAGKVITPNKETDYEQNLVHHWSFPWHRRGDRQGSLGIG